MKFSIILRDDTKPDGRQSKEIARACDLDNAVIVAWAIYGKNRKNHGNPNERFV